MNLKEEKSTANYLIKPQHPHKSTDKGFDLNYCAMQAVLYKYTGTMAIKIKQSNNNEMV